MPSNTGLRSSPRIACYGTAFLSNSPVDPAALKRRIAPETPQFSSPRFDASFLANCGRFLTGKTATIDDPRAYFKRVAGTDYRLPKATVFYQCSTEQRAAEVATEWYGMNGAAKAKLAAPTGRTQRRLSILNNLVALAKQAKVGQTKLMLRVVYRKQS